MKLLFILLCILAMSCRARIGILDIPEEPIHAGDTLVEWTACDTTHIEFYHHYPDQHLSDLVIAAQ